MLFRYAQLLEALGQRDESQRFRQRFTQIDQALKEIESVQKALVQRPRDPELRLRAAKALLALDRSQQARGWLEGVLLEAPDHAEAQALLRQLP